MSPTSISRCPTTCSSSFDSATKATFSYSNVISIVFCNSILIMARIVVEVSQPQQSLALVPDLIYIKSMHHLQHSLARAFTSSIPFIHDTSHAIYQFS